MGDEPGAEHAPSRIENWLTRAGTAAGAVAGLAGFVYLVGGVVMWLRFQTADLPADQGVALMSREQLFVIGLRLMILPLLVTAALVGVLVLRARTPSVVYRMAAALLVVVLLLLIVWTFGVVGWPPGLAVMLEALIVAGAGCMIVMQRRGANAVSVLTFAAIAALIVLVTLAVPRVRIDTLPGLCVAAVSLLAIFAPLIVKHVTPPQRRVPARIVGPVALAIALAVALALSSGVWPRVAIVLTAGVLVGVLAMGGARWPTRLRGIDRKWWLPLAVAAAVGLVVPWSYASASWPLAIALLLVVWRWKVRPLKGNDPVARRRAVQIITITAVVAAAIVSIGRQLDEPVQLLHATLTPKTKGAVPIDGVYVNASGDTVYLGRSGEGTIVAVPRDEVSGVALGPPEDRAPSPSLLSRIIPGDVRFAVRPLEVWCNGEKYHWGESHAVCRANPTLFWKPTETEHIRDFQRLGMPVRVWCPGEARRPCSGWILLKSRKNYRFGPAGVPRPIVSAPVPFSVEPSRPTEVCVGVTDGQFDLMRKRWGETPVGFDAVVARDRDGNTVFDRGIYWVKVGPRRVETRPPKASDCEPKLRLRATVKGSTVNASVVAWPQTTVITPRQVAGAVRVTAFGAGGAMWTLGKRSLKPAATNSEAHFHGTLPAGDWKLKARYTSEAGIYYPQAVDHTSVTIDGAPTPSPTPSAPKAKERTR